MRLLKVDLKHQYRPSVHCHQAFFCLLESGRLADKKDKRGHNQAGH